LTQNANFFDRKLATVLPEKNIGNAAENESIVRPRYTSVMATKLPLHEMTIQEKLAAMEALWEDLSRSPEAIESPEWHREILDERRQRFADGTSRFEDWETAKAKIREKLR